MERTPRSRSLQPFSGRQTPASPSSTDVTVAISPSRAIGKALRVAHAAGWIADIDTLGLADVEAAHR